MDVARIVVFRPGALGDALLAFPALAALRRTWPQAHLTLVARADVLPLARAAGLASATYPFDLPAWAGLWRGGSDAEPLLRAVVGGADIVVAWLRDLDRSVTRTLGALGVSWAVVAPGRPARQPHVSSPRGAQQVEHVAHYLLRTLAPLGMAEPPSDEVPVAPLTLPLANALEGPQSADALAPGGRTTSGGPGAASASARVVALHPGSGSPAKCWPPVRFAAVASRLRAARLTPLLIEGPADAGQVAAVQAVQAEHAGETLEAVRGMTVEALAARLAECSAYVGNDSGPTHLAAMLGCPTLALFGPTDPAEWAPLGRSVRVLRAEAQGVSPPRLDDLDVETVWAALVDLLGNAG